jgi:autotransporter-associated beta strand protein
MNIGAFIGGANGTLGGGSAGVVTYSIGALGANSTFAGSVSGKAAITKVGPGTQIISGPSPYTGATSVLDGILEITGTLSGTSSLTVAGGAVFYLAGGNLSVAGSITNNGIFKLSGTPSLALTGSFINNGVLDLINGPSTLPPDFVNNGVVLYASSVTVQQISISGTNVNLAIQSYLTHTYQLQRTNSLTNPAWTNIASPQTGNGSILNFTDLGGATGTQEFYRFQVSP